MLHCIVHAPFLNSRCACLPLATVLVVEKPFLATTPMDVGICKDGVVQGDVVDAEQRHRKRKELIANLKKHYQILGVQYPPLPDPYGSKREFERKAGKARELLRELICERFNDPYLVVTLRLADYLL